MTRRAIMGVVILVTWAGLVGWQVRREYMQPDLTRLARATMTLAPGTHFYSLEMGGQNIGMASSLLDTIPEGFLLEDRMNLEFRALGQPGAAAVQTRVILTPTLSMSEFSFSLDSEAGLFAAEGQVEGDSLLQIRIDTGGSTEEISFRVPEAPLFMAALPIRLAKGGELREGRALRFSVFDPSTVSLRTVEIEVLAQETLMLPDSAIQESGSDRWVAAGHSPVPAWHVRESFGGISVESWIDEDGRVIRSDSPMGFSIERTAYELALQAQEAAGGLVASGGPGADVIFSTVIASDADLGDVAGYEELRFVLSGVDLDGFELDGGRQELRGDTLVVHRETWAELDPGYTLPYPRMDLRDALEPEPLIQSGNPRIIQEARWAAGIRTGGRVDPRRTAERLTQAVFGMLEKEVSFSLPSATQVLETRRGDCNEHTVLFVAMARALGLPARVAVGLVYLDGTFFYHAWPEVWLGEWAAVDPTFGQVPADAAHLRFITGSLAQQVQVARLIGSLRIEVVNPEL